MAVSSLLNTTGQQESGEGRRRVHLREPTLALSPADLSSPDGTICIDFCHHLLPPREGAVVSHSPEGVVLDGMAVFEFIACSTLVELVTLWGRARKVSMRPSPH